jgi:prefoldin subunit 5
MAMLAQFPLEGGGFLIVEVDDSQNSVRRVMRGASPAEAIAKAADTFESGLEKVKGAVESMLQSLRSLAQPPDEVAVEFGVMMNAETGAVIAKAAAEANFKVNLTWRKSGTGGK